VLSHLKESDSPLDHRGRPPYLAFPHNQNLPAKPAKLPAIPSISYLVARQLPLPELGPGGRVDLAVLASMAVPEAAMDKDNLSSARKHEVGTARKIASMKSVAISKSMQHPPNHQLRLRILAANARHAVATLVSC